MLRMFDLAAADPAIRFSPFCWRVRMALALKGLDVETIPWRFTDKALLPEGHRTVPTLMHDGGAVSDSFAIATWLEETFPDTPSLFGGPVGHAHARLINGWADATLGPTLVKILVRDIWAAAHPKDQDYFRSSREQRLGQTLEEVHAAREDAVPAFRSAIHPARMTLRAQSFLGGERPSYADCIVLGPLMWARNISHVAILEEDDPISDWLARMAALPGSPVADAPRVPA
jgi:glutathione S-transferase